MALNLAEKDDLEKLEQKFKHFALCYDVLRNILKADR